MPKRGGKRTRATLKYEPNIYNPQGLQTLTPKQIRQEYSRLRAIANKRIARLADSEWSWTEIYQRNRFGFRKLKSITSESDLRYELTKLAGFISKETSSASGLRRQRAKTIATLKERGYGFVNTENFREFTEFMDYLRETKLARIYDSDSALEFLQSEEVGNKSEEELLDAFQKYMDKTEPREQIQNRRRRGSDQYRRALE